jgi:hypothetical protein
MARKHCSTRVRSRGKVVLDPDTVKVKRYHCAQLPGANWREWTFYTISLRKAKELERDKEVERITRLVDGAVLCVGYRSLEPEAMVDPTAATLTLATTNAVAKRAGLEHAKQNRLDICDRDRLTRREQRQVEKFLVWPLIGDTKAVAVRPRMYPQERRMAEAVLRRGYLKAA